MATTNAVDPNTSAAIYQALNGTSKAGATKASASDELQNRFLKLLTTQLKNQHPLNPLDNSQMTSQLAQISTVDGITQLNTTLQKLVSNATESQTLAAAGLVGQKVLVPGSGLTLSGGQAASGVELAKAADKVTVTIKDSSGLAVRTMELGAMAAGTHSFKWDGTTDAGAKAADGAYTISFSAQQGQNSVAATALQLGVVSSVVRSPQGVSLDVGSLGLFNMSDIKQIL